MSVVRESFGFLPDGTEIFKYKIENGNEMQVHVLTLGATLQSLIVKDKNGTPRDVLLGFDTVEGYLSSSDYQGATVGPVANRISEGELPLNGKVYALVKNEKNRLCLHSNGEFTFAVWKAIVVDADCVEFSYVSPDGVGGFPGELKTTVTFRLDEDNALHIKYDAVSDRDTYINLTNHAYFNLNGYDGGAILDHVISISSDAITAVDEYSIPTGEIRDVSGTPFDFRIEKSIGRDIETDDEQLRIGGGYDHNYCIRNWDKTLRKCACVRSDETEINMNIYTDLPGVQFYVGNFLDGRAGKAGKAMQKRSGFCLETQFYPDTPHRPEFPSCLYKAGERFESETVYEFFTGEGN